ncbi:hypothetical protein Tco_0327481 [Tanacetum coccineum]
MILWIRMRLLKLIFRLINLMWLFLLRVSILNVLLFNGIPLVVGLYGVTRSTTDLQTTTVGMPMHNTIVTPINESFDVKNGAKKASPNANEPNDADYDVWLPLASVHEVNDRMKNSLYGYFIVKRLAFLVVEWFVRNNWQKYGHKKVTLVKFHDVSLFAYTPDGLSLIATKISNPMMLDSDNLVMAVPNLDGPGYTKETIRAEYEWKPPRCSTCLIFHHSVDDCQKAPKQVVNMVDKGIGGSSGADDNGFIEVKKKKSGGINGGTKQFKPILVKPKTQYRLKVNQPTEGVSSKTAHLVCKKNVSTSGNSSKTTSKTNVKKSVDSGNKASTSDDDNNPLKMVDYSGDHDSEDEVVPVYNKMASFQASQSLGVGYGTNSLLEQWRETYENADYDYDPYNDDMYEDHKICGNVNTFPFKNFKSFVSIIKSLSAGGPINI